MTKRKCSRCGSKKVIPDVPLRDKYGDVGGFHGPTEVGVKGNPDAWFFTDEEIGQIVASICGECGHTELTTTGYDRLYAKYQDALEHNQRSSNNLPNHL